MSVVLIPSGTARERILNYGPEGAGKTYAAFCVMDKTPGKAWYLDSDQTVMPYLDGERFSHLQDKMEFAEPFDLGEGLEFVEKARQNGGQDDWLVIDRADWVWDAAQEEFSDKVFGTDIDEHMLTYRQSWENQKDKNKAGNPFDGFTDWTVIKKRHQRFMKNVLRFPGHVMMIAAEKKIIEGMEDGNTVRAYGGEGYKPAGEKNNGHLVRSVLRLQGNNAKTWRVRTVKDREREQLDGVMLGDFALDYLVAVGGWQMLGGE